MKATAGEAMGMTARCAACVALLLALSACSATQQSHLKDSTAAAAPPLNMTIMLAPVAGTAGSYVVYANPPPGQAHMYLCLTASLAACVPGQAVAAQMQAFTSTDGAKLYASAPLALPGDADVVLLATDAQAHAVLARQFRVTKPGATVALDTPKELQVFQRSDATHGKVTVRFKPDPALAAQTGRARVAGPSASNGALAPRDWLEFALTPGADGFVTQALDAPAGGWFQVEVQLLDQTKLRLLGTGRVNQVGVGEVFVVAGQSNSTNCGWTAQKVDNDFVVSTNGDLWQRGDDPQLGVHDDAVCSPATGHGGSNWPNTGNALVKSLSVPVAFASTGYSGTQVAQWLPTETAPPGGDDKGQTLFAYTLHREQQLAASGYRAVLWHQGENDAAAKTTHDDYVAKLTAVITGLRAGQPTPWLIAVASYCTPGAYPDANGLTWTGPSADIVKAQQDLVSQPALPELYAGPSTDDLLQDSRGTAGNLKDCHFNDKGLKDVGARWADKIGAFLKAKVQ